LALGTKALALVLAALTAGAEAAGAPASLIAMRAADPKTFVEVLAHLGVPAGLEIRQADYRRSYTTGQGWHPDDWTREKLARQPSVPLDDVVSAFNRRRGDYRATLMQGVVVIRPTRKPAAYLDSKPAFGRMEGQGLDRVAEKIFAPLDSLLDQPGARVGSRLSAVGAEVDFGDALQIAIDARGLSPLDALNRMAAAAPGHAWIVVTTDDATPRIGRFGFVHRHGATTTMSVGTPSL